jgi:hypothetical protein
MEIFFRQRDLQALCNSRAALERRWGVERAGLLAQRLHELAALDCLADVDHLPHVALRRRGRSIHVSVDDVMTVALQAVDGQPALGRADLATVTEIVVDRLVDHRSDA